MNTLTRRTLLVRTLLTGATSALVTTMALPVLAQEKIMTAPQAQKAALAREIVFVDIRTRQEWRETGIAPTAWPVSMRRKDFLQKLDKLVGGDRTKKIALICATGVRSAYMQKQMTRAGYSNVISVAEGMLGGLYGKGWIPRGMPVKKYTGS